MPPKNALSPVPNPHDPNRFDKKTLPVIEWGSVLDALDNQDVDTLLMFADQLCKESKPIIQEGVSINEQIEQIKRLAPGAHPHTSALVRGLCESLKQV